MSLFLEDDLLLAVNPPDGHDLPPHSMSGSKARFRYIELLDLG